MDEERLLEDLLLYELYDDDRDLEREEPELLTNNNSSTVLIFS